MAATPFVQEVKKLLLERNMSLRALARSSALDVSFISKMLSGKRNPPSSEKDIRKIAEALYTNPERLILLAGRIPSSLYPLLKKDTFISYILSYCKDPGATSSASAVRKTSQSFDTFLEDELL